MELIDAWRVFKDRVLHRIRTLNHNFTIPSTDLDGVKAVLAQFGTDPPLFPNITSLSLSARGSTTHAGIQLLFPRALPALTLRTPSMEEENLHRILDTITISFPMLETISSRSETVCWSHFSQDHSRFRRLRRLTAYDISYKSWKSLEGCKELEEIVLEDARDLRIYDLDPYFSDLQSPVILRNLRSLVFQCGYTWTYPSDYITALMEATHMPSLRDFTIDAASLQSDIQDTVMRQLPTRNPVLEQITIRHYSGTSRTLIDQLPQFKNLRKLTMMPYGNTVLTDSDVAHLAQLLPRLCDLSLRLDGRSVSARVEATPACLVHLAEHCQGLSTLDIHLNLSSQTLYMWQAPTAQARRVTHLRIRPVGLSPEMVDGFAAFIASVFPNASELSTSNPEIDANLSYAEDHGLPAAFKLAQNPRE